MLNSVISVAEPVLFLPFSSPAILKSLRQRLQLSFPFFRYLALQAWLKDVEV